MSDDPNKELREQVKQNAKALADYMDCSIKKIILQDLAPGMVFGEVHTKRNPRSQNRSGKKFFFSNN